MTTDTTQTQPPVPPVLLWAATCSTVTAAEQLAQSINGVLYADRREDTSKLPFAALVTGVTDNPEILSKAADVSLHIICQRTIKPGSAEVYGLFPLLAHPDLGHQRADDHWRDRHGPLALQHHAAMTHYLQLSVVTTILGRHFDGFALCGFANLNDLRHRFFTTEESRRVITADVAEFADTDRSPRRLVAHPAYYPSVQT